MIKTFAFSISAILLFGCIYSCKKSGDEGSEQWTQDQVKWTYIPASSNQSKNDFFEDEEGNIAYQNTNALYLFDGKGVLKQTVSIDLPNNESRSFQFIRDGSFFLKVSPSNTTGSDFIQYYKRLNPISYSRPILVDIRKLDSLNRYTAEYYIHDIFSDNEPTKASSSSWILASKYPDVKALRLNTNPQPVIIGMNDGWIGQEYVLPRNATFARAATSSSFVSLFAVDHPQSFTFDNAFNFLGMQQSNQKVPGLLVLGSFVVKAADGYYLSNNLMDRKDKVLGVPTEAKILHSKDSLVHVYFDGNYATVNAITGNEVFRFDASSEKMPVSKDSVLIIDYYRTKRGISYAITSSGIIVAN